MYPNPVTSGKPIRGFQILNEEGEFEKEIYRSDRIRVGATLASLVTAPEQETQVICHEFLDHPERLPYDQKVKMELCADEEGFRN